MLVCNGKKTLSNLCRQVKGEPDPKAAADFFRESPWAPDDIGQGRKQALLIKFLKFAKKLGVAEIDAGVDDSLGKKHKTTRHLEAVSYHHDHNEGSKKKPKYANGFVYVALHIQIGPIGFTFDTKLYLRADVVRKLNRHRAPEERLHFRSKYALARAMLTELAQMLPPGYKVTVLFDSWYASAKLIKFCRRQGWHVICAIKTNRRIDKMRVDRHDQALRNKRYQEVALHALNPLRPAPVYYIRTITGHLEDVPHRVGVIISRKHKGDNRPRFFAFTELTLSAQQALRTYQRRWPVEVDNLYLKIGLGLGDFRLRSFEAIDKWFAVSLVSLNFLQFQQAQCLLDTGKLLPLADFVRQHRWTHLENVIRRIAEDALLTGDVEEVLKRHLPSASWAII